MRPAATAPHLRNKPRAPVSAAAINKFRQWTRKTPGESFTTVMIWLVCLIMVVPPGLDYAGINGMPTSGDMISKFVWLTLMGGGFGILLQHRMRLNTLLTWINPFLLCFLALAALSYFWSIEPAITMKRAVRAATVVAVCIAFTLVTWEPRRFQKLLRTFLTTVMVVSIIFTIVSPENAIHHSEQEELKDAWHGIMIGKNLFGSLASMCVILWIHGWISKETSGFKSLMGGGVALFCLIMTRSAGSMLATAFGVCFLLLLLRSPNTFKRSMPYLIGLFATAVLLYALAVLNIVRGLDIILQPIAMFTGKDLTFTGRTAIWEILKEHIAQRPLLGSGYGAYWIGPMPSSPSFEHLIRLYFYPTEGHNGYLDVINDLGWIGGACLLGYFISYIRQSLALMKIDRYQGALYLTLIFRGFLADMSESHWFISFSVDFAILTFATTNLGRHLLHNKLYKNAGGQLAPRGW